MNTKIAVILFLYLVLNSIYGKETLSATSQVYQDPKQRFSFQLPTGWQAVKAPTGEEEVFTCIKEENVAMLYLEGFKVGSQYSLQQIAEIFDISLEGKEIAKKEINFAGKKALLIERQFKDYSTLDIYTVNNGYGLFAHFEWDGSKELFQKDLELIISSFKFGVKPLITMDLDLSSPLPSVESKYPSTSTSLPIPPATEGENLSQIPLTLPIPQTGSDITGVWATSDGSLNLELTPDSKYTMKVISPGANKTLQGSYTITGDTLSLEYQGQSTPYKFILEENTLTLQDPKGGVVKLIKIK